MGKPYLDAEPVLKSTLQSKSCRKKYIYLKLHHLFSKQDSILFNMKGFFFSYTSHFYFIPFKYIVNSLPQGRKAVCQEVRKRVSSGLLVLPICQFIKEILLEAYKANKRWIFLPWMEDRWSRDTERKISEGPGERNPVLGSLLESGRGKISGRARWCRGSV